MELHVLGDNSFDLIVNLSKCFQCLIVKPKGVSSDLEPKEASVNALQSSGKWTMGLCGGKSVHLVFLSCLVCCLLLFVPLLFVYVNLQLSLFLTKNNSYS